VGARRRVDGQGKEVLVLVNHECAERDVRLPWRRQAHLGGAEVDGNLRLAPYGVAVLTPLPA
jgi:hypothetical protein